MAKDDKAIFLKFQVNEITEHHIYKHLAFLQSEGHNRQLLIELSREGLAHYQILRKYTGELPPPKLWKVFFYTWTGRLLGLTFSIKLMEKGEKITQQFCHSHPDLTELRHIALNEEAHEAKLIELIDEEGLNYIGSVVLGLNDALVEFTGALAGYAFALQHARLVALTGAITGIAAALSMAASEYLSTKAENNPAKNALKASLYTGIAYIITVAVLISPFALQSDVFRALGICLFGALVIIAIFNYYYSIVKSESFGRRFLEMATISLGIAAISFLIGYVLRILTEIKL